MWSRRAYSPQDNRITGSTSVFLGHHNVTGVNDPAVYVHNVAGFQVFGSKQCLQRSVFGIGSTNGISCSRPVQKRREIIEAANISQATEDIAKDINLPTIIHAYV